MVDNREPTLSTYLAMQRLSLDLDSRDDGEADSVRDAMDPLWHLLSDEEHDLLSGLSQDAER